jgi:transporter family-2 protein
MMLFPLACSIGSAQPQLKVVFVSFSVAFFGLVLVAAVVLPIQLEQDAAVFQIHDTSWWMYLGAFPGLLAVYGMIYFPAFLNVSGVIVCQTAGQLLMSLLIDTMGLFGFAVKAATSLRIVGVCLVCLSAIALQVVKQHQLGLPPTGDDVSLIPLLVHSKPPNKTGSSGCA